MIVVDATVLCYYTIPGEHTESVRQLRDWDSEWTAPELWKSEVMNVLWKYLRRGDLQLDLAFQHFELAHALIETTVYEPTANDVLPIAVESGVSTYDCQYVAVARRLGVPLATHDGAILNAFPETAASPAALTTA